MGCQQQAIHMQTLQSLQTYSLATGSIDSRLASLVENGVPAVRVFYNGLSYYPKYASGISMTYASHWLLKTPGRVRHGFCYIATVCFLLLSQSHCTACSADSVQETGWGVLELETVGDLPDMNQAYAAGYVG
jgi:hypothetical protein